MATTIPHGLIATSAKTLLETIGNVGIYRGKPPDKLPTIDDDDLRVKPHVVIYAGGGGPAEDVDLEGAEVDHNWTCQLSCVAGRESDALQLIEAVQVRFERWQPTITAYSTGRCRQLNDPGPLRRDDKQGEPPRYWLPLAYGLAVGN